MIIEPADPLDAALRLAAAFDAAGVPYAIGGALAYSLWAIPRATVDVDLNVFVTDDQLQDAFAALTSLGIQVDREQCLRESANRGMFVVHFGTYRVDAFTPSIPFAWEAARTKRREKVEGIDAWFLSPEALAVFKLLFFRGKDLVDLERLIAVRKADLDVDYVRRQIVEMMGAYDDRVTRWDELVRAHGGAR